MTQDTDGCRVIVGPHVGKSTSANWTRTNFLIEDGKENDELYRL